MSCARASRTASASPLGLVGLLFEAAGALLIGAGSAVWVTVSRQLARENITVAPDAKFLANRPVRGPLTAYAQAEIINAHALKMSDGKTYAELDREDPIREVVMSGSFLRASLFTSVVAFGVSAFAVGIGVLAAIAGAGARSAAR